MKRRRFSEAEVTLAVQLYWRDGKSLQGVAEELNSEPHVIRHLFIRNGIPRRTAKQWRSLWSEHIREVAQTAFREVSS